MRQTVRQTETGSETDTVKENNILAAATVDGVLEAATVDGVLEAATIDGVSGRTEQSIEIDDYEAGPKKLLSKIDRLRLRQRDKA